MIELETEFGPIELGLSYYDNIQISQPDGDPRLDLTFPDESDPDSLAEGVLIRLQGAYGRYNEQEAAGVIACWQFARQLAGLYNETAKEQIAEAKRKKAEAEAEAARAREERVAVLAERKERLLTEFMGERVKVRERGYKTMRQAEVTAREVTVFDHASYSHKPTGEFEPWLRYTSDVRTQDINRMQRLDVRVGSKWMTVWDDGLDDLPYYDNNLSTSAAPADPYDGRL